MLLNILMGLFGLILSMLGVALISYIIKLVRVIANGIHLVSTEGIVVTSEYESLNPGDAYYKAVVLCEYDVDGKRYRSKNLLSDYGASSDLPTLEALIGKYPLGGKATVFYNPKNPGESIEKPNALKKIGIILLCIVGTGATAFAGYVLFRLCIYGSGWTPLF
jgi:hypothetical protein